MAFLMIILFIICIVITVMALSLFISLYSILFYLFHLFARCWHREYACTHIYTQLEKAHLLHALAYTFADAAAAAAVRRIT